MKVRFDGLDVTSMAAYLQRTMTGRRVVNVYDGGGGESANACYVIKLDGSGSGGGSGGVANTSTDGGGGADDVSGKSFLLLESGIRFHPLSHFTSETPMPSPFCAKLRKHLRGLRLEQVLQFHQTDRVVMLQFGVGASKHSLILELYAKGNLILTNDEYRILALLRSHVYDEKKDQEEEKDEENNKNNENNSKKDVKKNIEKVSVQVNHVYPVTYATMAGDALLNNSNDNNNDNNNQTDETQIASAGILSSTETMQAWVKEQLGAVASLSSTTVAKTPKKKKGGKASLNLKTLLLKPTSGVSHYGPALLEHCVLTAELPPHQPLTEITLKIDDWLRLQTILKEEGPRVMKALQHASIADTPGYILYQPRDDEFENKENGDSMDDRAKEETSLHSDKILQEFLPHLLKQNEKDLQSNHILEYPNFGAAVAEFFARMDTQKRQLKAISAERAAKDKLERVRRDQQDRLLQLERDQIAIQQQARAIQASATIVDQALTVINSALDSGMDWDQLESLVQVEKEHNQNPVALIIEKLELDCDSMILRLPRVDGGGGTAETSGSDLSTMEVRISLKETAFANANILFGKYRASKEKAAKTIEASTKALQAAEETAKRQLLEAQTKNKLVSTSVRRKPAWYEKFLWFVTSDNYLVLGGRDAHQNELLVKRYLRSGDAYLHADVHGAASCVLRAKRRRRRGQDGKTEPISLSEQALREAGNFTICRSSAWTSKMVTSAWWVEAHQVSKTAPTGEYLTVGSFMVRGKKNFLPPSQLEMGLAVLFRLGDDDSIVRHKNERRDFALMALEDEDENDDDIFDGNSMVNQDMSEPAGGRLKERSIPGKDRDSNKSTPASSSTQTEAIPESETEGADADEEASSHSKGQDEADDSSDAESNAVNDEVQSDADDQALAKETSNTDDGSENDGDDDNSPGKNQKKKSGLSVRDRKLIKKYGSLEEADKVLGAKNGNQPNGNGKQKTEVTSTAGNVTRDQDVSKKRGKKAKMKRAQKKYGDQDEEDRELAMLALQGGEKSKKRGGKSEPKETQTQKKVAAETAAILVKDSSQVASQLPQAARSILAECVTTAKSGDESKSIVRWEKFDASTIEQLMSLDSEDAQLAAAQRLLTLKNTVRVDNFSASLGGIIRTIKKHGYKSLQSKSAEDTEKTKRKTKEEKAVEVTKWKETLADEGLADSEPEEEGVDDTVELAKLTSKPVPEDLVLYAIPVCAPYQTLSQYTYRVKLTPGNMKRGKAAKQCIDLLTKIESSKSSPVLMRQLDLIKKISDNDWVQVICSDVKISAPGANKAVKKQKANTKKSKK